MTLPTVLACGAWQHNTACLLVDGRPVWSAQHGDLSDPAACLALEASARRLLATCDTPVAAVAHDLHPDFFSTRLAQQLAAELGVPAIAVQHHHAHIAAVVAEHHMDAPVMGLALDGVGLGTDGGAWGGELLYLLGPRWQRLGHLAPLALPGGDRAAREPWRMAASALHALGRADEITERFGPRFDAQLGQGAAAGLRQMLDLGLNCPPTSSAGRWFDAAAGALGLSLRQTEDAQAARALEAAAARWLALYPDSGPSPGALVDHNMRLDPLGLMPALLAVDLNRAAEVDAAAAGFHLALADGLVAWAMAAAQAHGVGAVCLGGGCFFNRVLSERVTTGLQQAGLTVLRQHTPGCGDAGLALGQAWVAAEVVEQGLALTNHTTFSRAFEGTETCV